MLLPATWLSTLLLIFHGTLQLQTVLQKASTRQGKKKKISVLVVSMERNKPRRQVSHVSEGRTGIPGIPALMEKRCHCLAAEMHATGSLLNQSTEHAHAPSRKSGSRCILKHPPCLQQQVHWADTHPLGTTS